MTDAEPTASPRPRRLDLVRVAVVLAACLALGLSAVVVQGASPSPTGGPGLNPKASLQPERKDSRPLVRGLDGLRGFFGKGGRGFDGLLGGGIALRAITITRIAGTTIDLKTDDGWTRTITVGPDVKITRGGQPAAVGDLKVGDKVGLRQKRNADGSYTVVALAVRLPIVAGTISAIGPDSLTIKTRDGSSRTVTLTGSTTYRLGRADAKKGDLKVGAQVIVAGTDGSGGSFSASSVWVELRLARIGGVVTAKTADAITIKQGDGTTATIKLAAGARFVLRGVANPTLANIAVGMRIAAFGTKNADGSFTATFVTAKQAK